MRCGDHTKGEVKKSRKFSRIGLISGLMWIVAYIEFKSGKFSGHRDNLSHFQQ